MANKPNDTGAKSTTSTLNSSWFKNTLKSLGSAGGAMIKDIMPATAETLGSATSSATDIVRSIRSSRTGVTNITKNLSNNQVVRSGQQFFKNAIDDLKSGKLYNTERDAMGGDEDFNPDSLFGDVEDVSFSDFGDEQPSQVNVVNQNIQQDGGMGAATLKAIEKSTEYNLQATKATVDTMVSISSTNMLGINRIGEEITNQLTAINSNLSALIEYNNTNMTKFIDASIGYYEQMSAKAAESNQSSDRISMNDIYSANGGLDFKNYAKFIRQNAKDYSESTMVGGALKMFLDNKDMLIGGLIANPIGTALQFGMKSILPEVTKQAAKALDESIKDFIPVMLERIGNLDEITGPFSGVSSFIAKTFGIKTERKEKFRLDKLDKGPVPYNGMANTAIVEIIPKHLREANSYLKTIAETLSGRFGDAAKGTETGFDWETGEFRDMNEIRKKFYDSLEDSTANIFRGSKFGQKMASQRELLKSEDDRKKYDEALTQLYGAMERHKGTLDFKNKDHMDELMAGINSSQNVKTLIQSYINHLQETADEAIGNAIATKSKATREKNRVMQDAENNATERNLRNFVNKGTYDQYIKEKYSGSGATQSSTQSAGGKAQVSLHGVVSNIYDLLSRGIYVKLRNFKDVPTGGAPTPPLDTSQNPPETPVQTAEEFKAQFNAQSGATATPMGETENLDELSLRQRFGVRTEKKINMFKGVIDGIMAGNSDKAFDEMMNAMREKFHRAGEWISEKFLTPIKKTLFGEKDEDGYKRGGIFEGIHNRMRESFFSLRRMINGKGYLTADGEKIEDANEDEMKNTVKGKLHGMLTFLKDGIKEKLFGKEPDEETGEEGKKGILGKAKDKLRDGTNALIKGLVGWKKALFGGNEDENSEEDGKKVWESIKKRASDVLPTALAGSIVGVGGSFLASGILGTLVGGPIGGALLGLAGGIAARSDKFKDWLFGPEDQDGKRIGGVISEKTQDFIKDNGKYLAGGAALGLAKGVLFPGSGLLVNLVGGPIAGAVTGLGTSIILRSRMFQNFLFGNEDTGQKGLVNIVKGWFGKLGRKKDGDPSTGKLLGMAGIGMGAGALTGQAILNTGILGLSLGPMGPIGGALLGLGGAILAQKKNFKEWLFGTVDPDTGEKRLGIIGKFGDMLRVNVGIPLKNTFLNIKDKFASFMEDHVFTKFNHIIEPIGNAIFGSISKFTGKAIDSMAGIGDVIKENFLQPAVERLGKIISPVIEVGRKALEAASTVAMTVIKAPINVFHAITSPIAQAMAKTAKAAVGVVTTAVNLAVVKPIKNFVVKPLVAATHLATTIISAPFKIVSSIATTIHDKVDHFVKHVSAFVVNLGNRFKDWLFYKNPVAKALRGAVAKVKDFGARVKNTFKIMVKPLGDFVKSAITEVKNHMIQWVGKFFSFLNPVNLIKGLYNLMRGRKKEQDKDPSQMGFIRKAWYLANPDVYGYETPGAEKLENMSERERRTWARRDRKMGFTHERWTDNRDGTTYEYTKDKKSVRVVYANGKTDLISAAEFDRKFPKSERDKLMKKSVDENGNEVDAVLSRKVSGRGSKSEYDRKKDKREREAYAKDLALIKKWAPTMRAVDTAEARIIAQQNAAAKGKKITFHNANPFDDARLKEINERMGKASLDAEEATAKHTKDTVTAIDRIYYSMKFGFKLTDEEVAWYKNNKKSVDAKRSFLNGHDSVPEEYTAEEALQHGASQARTYSDPNYKDATHKEKKKASNRYSEVRQRRAARNFTKLGFFGGLKRNFRDMKNYITGGMDQLWNEDEIPNELKNAKDATHHAQGGTASQRQVSEVGENGPEFYQPAGASRKYIIGENGSMFVELHPGDTIHPNSAVQAGTSAGDMSDLTDSELLGIRDTSKLSIDERILHELIGINKNMRLLGTARTGFFGAPGGFTSKQLNEYIGRDEFEEPELDEDGNPIEGSGYKTKNLSELFDRFKGGAGAIVNAIPGSGLVRGAAHGVGSVFGFGKTLLGAGFELGHNAFTATGHMFGHAKNAVGTAKDAFTLEDKSDKAVTIAKRNFKKKFGYDPSDKQLELFMKKSKVTETADKDDSKADATVKPVTDPTSETEEERKAREAKEDKAQKEVSQKTAGARQAERAEIEEVEGDNLRDEERNSLLKKIGDKLGGFKDVFSSIFSKKGLIGAAIIAGGALLSKLAPILFKYGKIGISKLPSITEIKDKVVNIWDNLPTWDTVKATIMSVPTKAKELFGTVKDGVISAWDWVYDRWGDAIDTVKNWGITTGQRIKDDAIYGWNNLGDGDRPIDALEDEAIRFTRIADEYGNIDNESEARAKLKWRAYSGWGDLAVNKFSKDKYNDLLSYGTNNNGIKGLWDRIKTPAKWGKKYNELLREAEESAKREAEEAAKKAEQRSAAVAKQNFKMKFGYDPSDKQLESFMKKSKVTETAAKSTADTAATVAKDGFKGAVDDVAKAGAKKAEQSAAKATAEVAAAKVATEDSLWKKSIKLLEDGMTSVVEKVGTKVGSSRAVKGAKTGLKGIKSVVEKCKPFFKKVAGKIGKVLGVTAALGATVVGLAGKEVTWITIGAINGLTGTQRLFRTDEVDTTMTIISTVIGGLLGTTVGSIIDIINELVVSVTGTDIIAQLATIIYTAIMDFTGNKELSEKLRKGQDEFKSKFEKDKTTSLKQQYSTMIQAGLIDKSVTEAEFIQGAEEGKYGARIKSFADYNDEQHKNLAASMLDKAKGGLTSMKRSFIGETTTTYTDKSGNVYTDAGDGMWLVTNKDGKELGTVGQDAIPEDATENVEKTEGVLVKLGKGLLKILKPIISCLGTIVPVIASDAANMFGGDPAGIINNMPDIGEDTPGGGLSKALLFLTKGLMLPGSVMWWGIHKFIMPVLGHVIDGIGATVTGIVDSISNAAGAMVEGNIMKLWGGNWDAKSHGFDSGDGVGAGIGAGLAYVVDTASRVLLTPFTLVSAGIHLIVDPILGITHGIGGDWDKMTDSIGKSWEFANNGEPGKVWTDTTFECDDDDIIAPVFHVISAVNNVFATIWGGIKWVVNKVSDIFSGIWDFISAPFRWIFGDDDDISAEIIKNSAYSTSSIKIKGYATGTQNAQGGPSIVGERGVEAVYNKNTSSGRLVGQNGPEVVNLNKGDVVIPNTRVNATMSSNGLSKLSDTQLGAVSDTRQLTVSERILKAVSENEDSEGTKKFQETEIKNSATSNKTLSDITAVLRAGFGLDKNNNPIATTNKNVTRTAGVKSGTSSKTYSGTSIKRKATWYEHPETAYGAYTPAGQTLISGYSVAANPADYPGGTILEITGGGLDGTYRVDDCGCDQGTIDFFYNTGKVPAAFRQDGTYSINVKAVGGSGEDDSNESSDQKNAIVQRPADDKLTEIVNESTEKIAPRVAKAEQSGELKATVTEDPHRKRFGKTITSLHEVQGGDLPTYYSQNDPRWANLKFGRSDGEDDGATMSSTGCGPTAMAMALSDMTDSDINPIELAQMAQRDGYRDDSGVNAAFIEDAASAYHVNSSEHYRPSKSEIEGAVETGMPVVLLGKRPSSLRNNTVSPYTRAGHYIVANGFDRYGNIMISDPRGLKYNLAISPKDLARDTVSMWSFNGNNPMLKRKKRFKRYRRGGLGNEYLSWLQSDPRWGNKPLGDSNETMTSAGCYVTSIAKLMMHTNCIADDNFNPGYLCQYCNDKKAFSSSGDLNTNVLSDLGFSRISNVSVAGKSAEYITNACAKYINDGYAVVLFVKSNHAVAIVDIENNQLVMSDPAQNDTTNVFEKYDVSSMDSITWFQGASTPKKVNYEYTEGDGDSGIVETAKKIVEPVAEVGGAFAKLASAIFKAILTGNWDIDWDAVFADEDESTTSATNTTPTTNFGSQVLDNGFTMVTPDTYIEQDTSSVDGRLWKYLTKTLKVNDYGAASIMAYINHISGDSGSRFVPDDINTNSRYKIDLLTGSDIDFSSYNKANKDAPLTMGGLYSFLVNSKIMSDKEFSSDGRGGKYTVPFGLLGWNTPETKKKLYETLKTYNDIQSVPGQLHFIYDDIRNTDGDLFKKITDTDSEDYEGIFKGITDYVNKVRISESDKRRDLKSVSYKDVDSLMFSIYDLFHNEDLSLIDDYDNNAYNGFNDLSVINLIDNPDELAKLNDQTGPDMFTNVSGRKSANLDLLKSRYNAIKSKYYNDTDMPTLVARQIFKDKDSTDLYYLMRYSNLVSGLSKISGSDAESNKEYAKIILDTMVDKYSLKSKAKSIGHGGSQYDIDNTYLYNALVNNGGNKFALKKRPTSMILQLISSIYTRKNLDNMVKNEAYNIISERALDGDAIAKKAYNELSHAYFTTMFMNYMDKNVTGGRLHDLNSLVSTVPFNEIYKYMVTNDGSYVPRHVNIINSDGTDTSSIKDLYEKYMSDFGIEKTLDETYDSFIEYLRGVKHWTVSDARAKEIKETLNKYNIKDYTHKTYEDLFSKQSEIDSALKSLKISGLDSKTVLALLTEGDDKHWDNPTRSITYSIKTDDYRTASNGKMYRPYKTYIALKKYFDKRDVRPVEKSQINVENMDQYRHIFKSIYESMGSNPALVEWMKTDTSTPEKYMHNSIFSENGGVSEKSLLSLLGMKRYKYDNIINDEVYSTLPNNNKFIGIKNNLIGDDKAIINKISQPISDERLGDVNKPVSNDAILKDAKHIYDKQETPVRNVVNPDVDTRPTKGTTTTTTVSTPITGGGGFGDGINGTTYYSQNDPRWADTKFIKSNGVDDGATMSNTGCGPTAMAMALSDATGNDINPLETASLAQMMGSRDDTGVNWNFIRDGAMAYGVSTLQSINPSREFILNSVKTGSPVILSGQSRGETNSPYTTSGHYVVATGVDNHNNITINDPRGQSYNKTIPISELTRETGSAWLFGRNPSLRSRFTRYENKRHGGRGNSDWRSWLQSDERWGSLPLGTGGCTVASHGCAVVSCAKIIMLTNSTSDSNFNPAVLVEYLNNNGGFSGSDLIWSALPYITCEGSADFDVLTKSNIASVVKSLMDEGYGVILECDNGNHWIPVMSVDGDRITMADSARNRSDDFFAEYPPESCCTYKWFKGSMSPMSTAGTTQSNATQAESNATQAETDEFSKASSIASKAGNAIFKAGYTGNWDIDWDSVFAEEVASDTSGTSGTSSTSSDAETVDLSGGADNEQKIWEYMRSKGYSEAGTAGIMGCWMKESGLIPNAREGHYTGDPDYTEALDSGAMSKQEFVDAGRYNDEGYGLAQWTDYNRKDALYDWTIGRGKSIGNLGAQLDYANAELNGTAGLQSKGYGYDLFVRVGDYLKNQTSSPEDGAIIGFNSYENNGEVGTDDQWQEYTRWGGYQLVIDRKNAAREIYDRNKGKRYTGGGSGEGPRGSRGSAPTVKSVKYIDQARPKSSTQSSDNTASQDSTAWLSSSTLSYEEQQYTRSNRAYSDDSLKRMVQDVLIELKTISANSDNLTYLKDINSNMSDSHNLYVANNTNNNTVNNNSSNRVGQRQGGSSHTEQMARRIAFGR